MHMNENSHLKVSTVHTHYPLKCKITDILPFRSSSFTLIGLWKRLSFNLTCFTFPLKRKRDVPIRILLLPPSTYGPRKIEGKDIYLLTYGPSGNSCSVLHQELANCLPLHFLESGTQLLSWGPTGQKKKKKMSWRDTQSTKFQNFLCGSH